MYGTSLGSSTECPKLGSYGRSLGTKPLGRLNYTLKKPTCYEKTDFGDFPNTHLASLPPKNLGNERLVVPPCETQPLYIGERKFLIDKLLVRIHLSS